MKIIRNTGCRMCGGREFDTVVDFGPHPLVNSLVAEKDLDKEDPTFPLHVRQCRTCALVQLTDIVDAHEIYKNVDYLFYSSDMPTLSEYFKEYADDVQVRFAAPGDFVLEIGSNDGVLLRHFQGRNVILGVDPATNVAIRAVKRGIPTLPLFFSERLAGQIVREFGRAKVVMGNNCIAHLDGLHDLMRGVDRLLADDGVMVVECNYWGGMVKNGNYSLIYHDHYSYFSLKVWQEYAPRFGLRPFDAWVTPAQGGSLRMFLCKDERPATDRLKALEDEERTTRLNTFATSLAFRRKVEDASRRLYEAMEAVRAEGKAVAGYGAAAKGFTIIRVAGVGAEHISYFVDDSPAKQGWYTPVDHIPIISRAEAESRLPDYFLVLAPNYAKVILQKERKFLEGGGKIIVPYGSDIRTYDKDTLL